MWWQNAKMKLIVVRGCAWPCARGWVGGWACVRLCECARGCAWLWPMDTHAPTHPPTHPPLQVAIVILLAIIIFCSVCFSGGNCLS